MTLNQTERKAKNFDILCRKIMKLEKHRGGMGNLALVDIGFNDCRRELQDFVEEMRAPAKAGNEGGGDGFITKE